MWLAKAQEFGIDPETLYERAVKTRPPHWMKAPPYSQVNPIATSVKTPNPIADARLAAVGAEVEGIRVHIEILADFHGLARADPRFLENRAKQNPAKFGQFP